MLRAPERFSIALILRFRGRFEWLFTLGLLVVTMTTGCRGCTNEPSARQRDIGHVPPAVNAPAAKPAAAASDARMSRSILSRARTPDELMLEMVQFAFPAGIAVAGADAGPAKEVEIAYADGEVAPMRWGPDFVDYIVKAWKREPEHYFLADMRARGDKNGKVKQEDIVVELHVALVALKQRRLELVAKGLLADRRKLPIPWLNLDPSQTAGRISELKFDFGSYQIAENERPIGVRVMIPERDPPAGKLSFNADLGVKRQQEIDAVLVRTFPKDDQPKMRKRGGGERFARTCVELIRLHGEEYEAPSRVEDYTYIDKMLQCRALSELKAARPAKVDYLEQFRLEPKAMRYLPPDLSLAFSKDAEAEVKKASKAGKSWHEFEPKAKVTAPTKGALSVTDAATEVHVAILARGDLDGDGVQDLLVQTQDAATEGTYRFGRLYVLTRRSLGARLDVVKELNVFGGAASSR